MNRHPQNRRMGSISQQSQPYQEPVGRLGKSISSASSLDNCIPFFLSFVGTFLTFRPSTKPFFNMRFISPTFMVSLHLLCYQAIAQSTCMFALLGCPGGFASDSKSIPSTIHLLLITTDCVEQYCKYDCAPKCCALSTLSNIRSCLGDSSSTPTPTDPNYSACGTAIRIISACQTIIPTFSAASTAELEQCMCYENDGTFFPSEFDNGISACDAYFATASPSLVPVVSSYLGFCTVNQGAVETGSMSPAASSTAAPSIASSKLVLSTSKAQATVTGSTTSVLGAASIQGSTVSPTSSMSKNSSSRLAMPVVAVSHQFVIFFILVLRHRLLNLVKILIGFFLPTAILLLFLF
jgi:hypothetical protein